MSQTRSQELYDQWKSNGGDLDQYRSKYHTDVVVDGRVVWHPSFVYRHRKTPSITGTRREGVDSSISEHYRPPTATVVYENDSSNQLQDAGTDEYSHLLFKHRGTDTWMHIKSSESRIVGEPIGFEAYVTIRGQTLTIGENIVSTDPHEVFTWAREWMRNTPDVSNLYDDK